MYIERACAGRRQHSPTSESTMKIRSARIMLARSVAALLFSTSADSSVTLKRVGGLEPFVRDSYGCKGVLAAKRRKRNPFRRMHPYHTSCPELVPLLEYCPDGNEMFDGPLPWSA